MAKKLLEKCKIGIKNSAYRFESGLGYHKSAANLVMLRGARSTQEPDAGPVTGANITDESSMDETFVCFGVCGRSTQELV